MPRVPGVTLPGPLRRRGRPGGRAVAGASGSRVRAWGSVAGASWSRARAWGTLARWLGPWADQTRTPTVERTTLRVASARSRGGHGTAPRHEPIRAPGAQPAGAADETGFDAWLYTPVDRAPVGAVLVVQGLHYAGPADPRLDRFCSILAASGTVVLAPFLPDFGELRVTPETVAHLGRAFDVLFERSGGARLGVFSISFGSLPALRLCAAREYADRVGSLVVFGGFADFAETVHYCLTGERGGARAPGVGARAPHDPLNRPVVVMNLIDDIDGAPNGELRAALLAGWRRYVESTWGRPEMKAPEAYTPVANRIAADLPAEVRRLFLIGCGVEPGITELCGPAIARVARTRPFLDARPHLAGLRCPVHLVHGVDDDVIPYRQSELLAEALPPEVERRVYLTGLYGHTSHSGSTRGPRALARELRTLVAMLGVLVDCPRRGL